MKGRLSLLILALGCAAGLGAQEVRVRDSLDRVVVLSSPARRVVSLSPSATECLFGIGAGGQVVGVTIYCDWPAEAASCAKVGGYSSESISLEKLLSLRPDLVVCDGAIHTALRESLERMGITVYVHAPRNVKEALEAIEDLGILTGRSAEAGRAAADLRKRMEAVAARVGGVPAASRVRVFWVVSLEPLMTCGSQSFLQDLITYAGGVNVFGDLAASWPVVSPEEVVRRAPAMILAADDGTPGLSLSALSKRPGWSLIPAVQTGAIRFLPADPISRTGPRMAEGAELIARTLYPELFP